jgi:hypothetical protein
MFRTTRDSERQRDINLYENIMATQTDEGLVNAAFNKLEIIRANAKIETDCEGLLLQDKEFNGYLDILVNRTAETGFMNVIIKRAENISREQACTIMSHLVTICPTLDIDEVHISVIE